MVGNISTYDPGLGEIRPSETGVEAASQTANRINRFYTEDASSLENSMNLAGRAIGGGIKDLGQAVEDNMYHKEISTGTATEASITNDITQQWNKTITTADPNDPNVAANFQKNVVQPKLDAFNKGFNTEKGLDWAERRSEAMTDHFNTMAIHGMGDLQGKAVEANLTTSLNDWSNTLMTSPASLPMLLKTADAHVSELLASSPNLRGEQLASARIDMPLKIKTSLVKAAAVGAIMQSPNPEATAAAYSAKYPDYINGPETLALAKTARTQMRIAKAADNAQRVEDDRVAKNQFHADAVNFELGTTRTNPTTGAVEDFSPPNLRDTLSKLLIKNGKGVAEDPSLADALIHRTEEIGKQNDPASSVNMERTSKANQVQLFSSNAGPEEINKAYSDSKLTWAGRKELLDNYNADKSEAGQSLANERDGFFKAYAGSWSPDDLYKATQNARRMEGLLRTQGKDPHELYDHASPQFFGTPENLSQFKSSVWDKSVNTPTIPKGMSPSEAIKKYPPGTRIILPDGSIGRVPGVTPPQSR